MRGLGWGALAALGAMAGACAIQGPPVGTEKEVPAEGGSAPEGGMGGTPIPPSEGGTTGDGGGGMTGAGGVGGVSGGGGNGQQPPQLPVFRIPLRIHFGDSALEKQELQAVLEEINWIWWSQAAICFEVEAVTTEATMSTGFDMWVKESSSTSYNGYYAGDHDIWTLDYPSLGSAPNPTQHPCSRTGAHELGHGLTLSHYNGQSDSNDSLMSSGKKGWQLHQFEIDDARDRASEKALDDQEPIYCAPIVIP